MSQTSNIVFDTIDGWLTVGSTFSDVEKRIGHADSIGTIEQWQATGESYQQHFYDNGLTITYLLSDTEATVFCIELTKNSEFQTSRGIHIGDRKQDVLKFYRFEIGDCSLEDNMSMTNNLYEGTYFFYQNGLIWRIVIGSLFG